MNDDYLWEGTGKPDPEVQRLERLLSRFRHNRPASELPLPIPDIHSTLRRRFWLRWPRLAAAAAMAAVLLAAGTWLATRRPRGVLEVASKSSADHINEVIPSNAAWEVTRLEGSVKVGSTLLGKSGRLPLGEWLVTDASSRVRIAVGKIGQVEVEPNTRIRLLDTRPTEHRLALPQGTIQATIWAPPRQFFVETPSAVAIDLGCKYTLQVDDQGAGLVRVAYGWVGFELNGRESFIPAGALCATRPRIGPGTPYFADASKAFQAALAELDFEKLTPKSRATLLGTVLTSSRKRDAFTLWHLLSRVDDAERSRVYDRLAALAPPPAGATRQGVLKGDKRTLDLWWNSLGLGKTSWWRLWEGSWPQQVQ